VHSQFGPDSTLFDAVIKTIENIIVNGFNDHKQSDN